ncbi:MAG: DNA-binding transcriptional regulator [Parvibaculum sp.]|nr:DNA-binding transcriptional regulator [Parvibaculum sp.]
MNEKTPEIQPIIRALQVLEALNLHTVMPLAALHEATGLPKSTLVRLLDTLIAGGYVVRVSRNVGYAVTERVLQLAGGFRHADRIVEASRPFLSAMTAQHKWPMAIATPDGDVMLVRNSTRAESPFATDKDFLGRRVSMLLSALGRAYIAFLDAEERETLLSLMRNSRARRNAMAKDERAVARMISHIQTRGYATAVAVPGELHAGFAVPVMDQGRPIAAITLRYYGAVMTEDDAAKRFLGPMQDTAKAIAAGI